MAIECNIEVITPDIAAEYLSRNIVNRSIKKGKVKAFASDMRNGAWELNGETICFNEDNKLTDGQHRLSAIIESNTPVQMLVAKGIRSDVTLYDRGANRSEADALIISGMDRSLANSTIIAMIKFHYTLQTSIKNVPFVFIKDFIEENRLYLGLIYGLSKRGRSSHKNESFRINVSASPILLPCFYALASKSADFKTVERFIEVLRTGFYDNTKHESPAIVLRNDLMSKNLTMDKGGLGRNHTCFAVEKALYDFINKNDRIQSYKNHNKPIYSNNKVFMIDTKKYK